MFPRSQLLLAIGVVHVTDRRLWSVLSAALRRENNAELWATFPSSSVKLLLVIPPMTQLNTPYPATAYLTGFLRQHQARLGLELAQADAALELFLRVFSRAGIQRVLDEL